MHYVKTFLQLLTKKHFFTFVIGKSLVNYFLLKGFKIFVIDSIEASIVTVESLIDFLESRKR